MGGSGGFELLIEDWRWKKAVTKAETALFIREAQHVVQEVGLRDYLGTAWYLPCACASLPYGCGYDVMLSFQGRKSAGIGRDRRFAMDAAGCPSAFVMFVARPC